MFTATHCLGQEQENPNWTLHDRFHIEGLKPFFFAGFQSLDEGAVNIGYVVLSSAFTLPAVMKHQSSSFGVFELQVCTPPALNKSSYWQMEPLSALTVAIGDISRIPYFSYTTISGRTSADDPSEECSTTYMLFTKDALQPLT